MTSATAADPRFWDRMAKGYSKQPVADEKAYRQTLDRVRTHLQPKSRVLELGCGTGSTALLLADCVAEYIGTDLSSALISIAKEKASSHPFPDLRFVTATVDSAEFGEASLDAVLSFNLFHLVENLQTTFARIHDLLSPGGLFISKTPCLGDYNRVLEMMLPIMQFFGKAPYINFFGKTELEALVVASGFRIIETGLYPAKKHSLFIVAIKE